MVCAHNLGANPLAALCANAEQRGWQLRAGWRPAPQRTSVVVIYRLFVLGDRFVALNLRILLSRDAYVGLARRL